MSQSDAGEMAALRQRFGRPPPATAAFQALNIVGMNAYLLYLVFQHGSSPVAIALYSVLELIVLSLITNVALTGVPKDLRVGSPDMPVAKRVLAIVAMSAFLCAIFWISVGGDDEHVAKVLGARNPIAALRELNILWPLLVMAGMAVLGSFGDRLRWQAVGGAFVTGASLSAAPKMMTAIIGPIVAALLSAQIGGANHEQRAVVWCVVYLVIKSALELLVLAWQFRGMPDGKANRPSESR